MRRPAAVLPLLGVALLLAGCGDTAAGDDGDGSGTVGDTGALAGRTFVSTEDIGVPGGGPLNLQFTDDGRLLASAGCNSTNGPVSLDGGRLDTGDGLAMTEMGCPGERMEADQWLRDLLSAEPTWELTDENTFVLTAGDTVVSMTDLAVLEPPVELTGRQWDVDGLSDGETASSMPAGFTAHLRFDDGTVSGFTGCNDVSGTATVDGDTIAFADVVVSDAGCTGGAAYVQDIVLAVLEGEALFSITGDRLSLETGSGFGLQAVAAG
ncbi:META domain-containing protein [Jiangella ureilytica]|uniref:META domain-containing protein n=1 Tax=Jiangella ureilytica TaxID=2530374 RepID=A0A4R4RBX0_9ACTN|nr:META domain-containing protein [Jiangella ureilytica]TDC46550.1 META domain-containing protein [Jiangella ureilytica]